MHTKPGPGTPVTANSQKPSTKGCHTPKLKIYTNKAHGATIPLRQCPHRMRSAPGMGYVWSQGGGWAAVQCPGWTAPRNGGQWWQPPAAASWATGASWWWAALPWSLPSPRHGGGASAHPRYQIDVLGWTINPQQNTTLLSPTARPIALYSTNGQTTLNLLSLPSWMPCTKATCYPHVGTMQLPQATIWWCWAPSPYGQWSYFSKSFGPFWKLLWGGPPNPEKSANTTYGTTIAHSHNSPPHIISYYVYPWMPSMPSVSLHARTPLHP